ncbi:universal stress protein [Pedococcus sp. KACC 23699]|uniref:Universal stress protein n=1 Tax=Pedococcus sp. KACC 23699 TaxID=3149228 RepID=A0AAU7JT74_9MICO
MHTRRRTIVVGIDLSDTSDLALRWAAQEAARRRSRLLVVHTYSVPAYPAVRAGVPGDAAVTDLDDSIREAAIRATNHAAQDVRTAHPGVDVLVQTGAGSPGEALVRASRDAALVVMGARGLGAFRGLMMGSVSTYVCAHAHCPVVVVHEAPSRSLPDARVVVGVDGSETSREALAFAFEQAASRGVGLTVVHTWELDAVEGVSASMAWSVDWDQAEEEERSVVAEAIAGFGAQYPTVDVRRDVARRHPVEELTRQSENACLLVVGTHGRGALAGWAKGSVSQSIVRSAHCPVAVVHPAELEQDDGRDAEHETGHHRGRDNRGFHLPVPPVRERL